MDGLEFMHCRFVCVSNPGVMSSHVLLSMHMARSCHVHRESIEDKPGKEAFKLADMTICKIQIIC